jgi:hypothetical protein
VEAPDSNGGSDHEHGTSTDHCTHVHGPAFPGAATWEASHAQVNQPHHEAIRSHTDHFPPPTHRPPNS